MKLTKKRGNMHPVGCNELGVRRSLKLSGLRSCFCGTSSFRLDRANERRRFVRMRGRRANKKKSCGKLKGKGLNA